MYFQTQRELWCHVITGALPNASILSEAYQSWISMGKFEQSVAKNKIELNAWNSPSVQSSGKQCNQRIFKIRCACLIKSFQVWSSIQDFQGACGVDPVSVRITIAQEQEIMEMICCFTELVKCVQKEKQNCISFMQSQPFNDENDYINSHKQSVLSKCLWKSGPKTNTNTEVDKCTEKIGAGDYQDSPDESYEVKYKRVNSEEHEVEGITSDDYPPQEFDVENSSDGSSVEDSCQSEDETDSNCSRRSSSSIDSGGDAPNNYLSSSSSKELIVNYDVIPNEFDHPPVSPFSRNNPFCRITGEFDHESDDENEFESRVQATMSHFQIQDIEDQLSLNLTNKMSSMKSFQDQQSECDESGGENGDSNTSSGYEFIDPEEEDHYSYLFDNFEFDLPPRPKTS